MPTMPSDVSVITPSSPVTDPETLPIVPAELASRMLQEPLSTNCSLIVGGGFGGLTAALSLAEQQPRRPVVLIEPRSQFLFQPHLYELLSDELQAW